MNANNLPRILLSHAGVQYSYKIAFSLYSAGILYRFYTSLYYQPDAFAFQILEKIFEQTSWFTALKERRYQPKIASDKIYSIPWLEIVYRLGSKLFSGRYNNYLITFQNNLHDHYVANRLQRLSEDFDLFYGFSGSALNCLEESKKLGKSTILDHHDIHQEAARTLMQEEIELHPDFADTFPYWPPHEPYIEKLEAEDCSADYHLVLSSFCRKTYLAAGIDANRQEGKSS